MAGHVLAICRKEKSLRIIGQFRLPTLIEALPVSVVMCG